MVLSGRLLFCLWGFLVLCGHVCEGLVFRIGGGMVEKGGVIINRVRMGLDLIFKYSLDQKKGIVIENIANVHRKYKIL